MRKILFIGLALLCSSAWSDSPPETQRVRVVTNKGAFVIALEHERAPLTTANFLKYVRAGHYEGTIFHRVVSGFVAQAGGFDEQFVEKPTGQDIPNESGNGLSNLRGTVGLARAGEPHSGDAQFYINLADNPLLDPQPSRWGYAVFGRIVDGMRVIDDIGAVATGSVGPFDQDAPLKPIVIEKIEELH
ncbi:MAG TPA: peptidylprolyl isomerase [Steroidobacter sp.]|jgi:cyclophilin family peptidyl-prolyl cis-trans isomerase|nr:peptidylprolyl isomerase [Steroidobacteraceae bacterium]HLS81499.1 peptidylprolyl isomerase [Steroidobacter sp.]